MSQPAPEVCVSPRSLQDDFDAVFEGLYSEGDLVWVQAGQRRFLLVNSPEYVREVMIERSAELAKPASQRIETGPPADEKLPDQEKLRGFRQALARGMGPERTPHVLSAVAEAVAAETAGWEPGLRLRLMPVARRIAIRTVCPGAFASRLSDDEISRLEAVMRSFDRRPRIVSGRSRGPGFGRRYATARLQALAERVLANADLSAPSEASAIVQDLPRFDSSGGRRSRAALAGELLLGAVGPLAQTAGWTLFRFADHSDAPARLRAEWDEVLAPGATVSPETLGRLRYTGAFVHEVARLHPTNVRVTRTATVDTTVGAEAVPANTRVVLNVNGLHRDPRFYEEPERLLPERWLNGRPGDKFAYVAFGVGERRCLGEGIAVTALVGLLPALVRDRDLTFTRVETTSTGRRQLSDDVEVEVSSPLV